MQKTVFPGSFLWGAATASAQIEGGWNEGGRTPSIWDVAPAKKIKRGEDCHTACDHFHRWREDVALMKELGIRSYRFSVSWSRVIPEEGRVNEEGLRFYSDLVDELLAAGIEPLLTVYHWDLPLWVCKKGGWLSDRIVPLFADYTKELVDALSDRVSWWMPMNEPQCFIMNAYMQGVHAPFKRDYLALSRLTENCLLAHAEAVKVIRRRAKKPPKVGIAMATGCFVPENESPAAIERARKNSFDSCMGLMANRWWMDPLLWGKPVTAYGVYRLSRAAAKEANQPLDFLGINVYQPFNAAEWGGDGTKPAPGAPRTSLGWIVDERVLYWTTRFLYERYQLPILVTENGMADNDFVGLDGCVHDGMRQDFLRRYLSQLRRAVGEGIPVLGYQHWSLMDNFEWAEGYDPRFGLIHVDFQTGRRTKKDSFYTYREIISSNGAVL